MPSPITASNSIDVQGMVSALMNVERRPLLKLQADAKKVDVKISAWGDLQSKVAAFRDAAAALTRLETWRSTKASSSDPKAVEVTTRAGAAAAALQVEVQRLAASQTAASRSWASADAVVGGGTLRLQMGTQPGGAATFEADPARAETAIALPAGATLAQVRDAINAAGAGVRASIVRDGEQVRLFVTSADSGGNQAFRLTTTDDDGADTDAAGLSALAFDPSAAAGAGRNLSLVRQASDAEYTIDGLALTARSNRIAGALDGVDLVLRRPTDAPVQVEVAVDTAALKASAEKFVEAYNGLNSLLASQTRYDEATKTAGALQGDGTAVGILGQLRSIVREQVTGGTLASLQDVGIRLQRDGSLKMDAAAFESAAVDPSRLEALFAAAGTGATDRGLMQRFRSLADGWLAGDGAVKSATDAWSARRSSLTNRQQALETRLSDVEKRLLRQYSSLDAQLAAAQQSGAALSSALGALPKP